MENLFLNHLKKNFPSISVSKLIIAVYAFCILSFISNEAETKRQEKVKRINEKIFFIA